MSSRVYYNPATPFETLLENVQPGMTVNVHGRRIAGDRFAIQFKTGSGPNADLGFRFCAKWVASQPEVIGNSRMSNQWGSHVTFLKGSSPFVMGQNFQVMIMIEQNGFNVAVNGAHFATFPHRISMYNLRFLEVEAAIAINQVSIYQQGANSTGSPSTVYKPPIPYETALGNVQPGMSFSIYGRPGGADRFGIQFKTGPGPNADMLFRFCPKWVNNRHEVIGNSRISNKWGSHLTFAAGSSPFAIGTNFQVMIVIESDGFKVTVNGNHFASFPHRMNMQSIKYFEVEGGVIVDQIDTSYQRVTYPPSHFPPTAIPPVVPPAAPSSPAVKPILNPPNERPLAIPFPNIKDHTVNVCGVPGHARRVAAVPGRRALGFLDSSQGNAGSENLSRFSIQFINGSNPPDIFFFFNPRLGQKVVARNSSYQSVWGAEETAIAGPFPFTAGQPFQVEISVNQRCFSVSVNGVHMCDFFHRQRPLNQITHLKFAGNVKISSLTFR